MKFNVKHTELKEVSDTILKDSEDYSTQIDNMISLVDNFKGYQYYDEMFGNALNREANNYEE